VFGADLESLRIPIERIARAAAVSQGVLLDPSADVIGYSRFEFDDVEGIQDRDGFGQFVADRVRIAAEGIQRRGL
jgi:hypothetical protein